MAFRRLLLVTAALMVCQTGIFIVRPMTSYRIIALGESGAVVGVVSAAFALAPLLLAVPFSRIAGNRHSGRLAMAGSAVMTLGCVGHALMRTVGEAVAASVVLGAGHVAVMIALQMLITGESPAHEYDRNFAWFTVGASVGQLLGPVIGTSALSVAGEPLRGTTTAMLLAAAATATVALLSVPLLSGSRSSRRSADTGGTGSTGAGSTTTGGAGTGGAGTDAGGTVRGVVGSRGAASAIYVGLVVLACIEILTAYLPVLGEERGIPPFVVGVLLSVRAAMSIASRVLIGGVSARMSRTAVLVGSASLASVCIVGITATAEVWLLVLVMSVLGFALGFGQPLAMSWLVLLVPARARGDALALRLIGNRLGQVVVPSVAAGLSGAAGNRSVFWMLGALLASSAWLVRRFRRVHGEGVS